MGIKPPDLSGEDPKKLHAAITNLMRNAPAALKGSLPSSLELEAGARASLTDTDVAASTFFQSMLEIGFLVASVDGFADAERHALAELLSQIVGWAVSIDDLELYFKDLADACDVLGRRERLRRAAADFEDGIHRGEAIGFAALVAIADGRMAEPEINALRELGGFLGLNEDDVAQAVGTVIGRLEVELGREATS
jgi:tellurite resistance protein